MLVYCQLMTQKAAAKILHIPGSTLSDLQHRSITRIRDGHRIRGLKCVGIDEISYCKGHKYATIVFSCPVDIHIVLDDKDFFVSAFCLAYYIYGHGYVVVGYRS